MMELLQKDQYAEFEAFASIHPNGHFSQSLEWIAIKSDWGHEVVVSRDEDGKIVGGMLILIKKIPGIGRNMLYSPRGPVCDYTDKSVLSDLTLGIFEVGKKHRAFLFKCDPPVREEDTRAIANFKALSYLHEPHKKDFETVQVRFNYALTDIKGKTEDEVLMSFTQKTRYNIRVAMKHGVECKVCGKEALPDFYRIFKVTSKRDNFIIRPIEYYEKLMDCLGEHMRLYLCYYEGQAVSGALAIQFAGKTWYLYGASDNQYRNVMPNYLMQWNMIKWAIEGGCSVYDFLGIPVNADPNSPMIGVYRFKKGFNGEVVGYAGEFDLILNSYYNNLFKLLSKAKRGYFKTYRFFRKKFDRMSAEK